MKKKFIKVAAVAATLALGAVLAVGCSGGASSSSSSSASSSSAAEAVDNSADIDTLTVGFDNSYPPYGFIGEDGEYTGLDLDLAKEVADRNGWEFVAQPIDWDAKDAELNSGNINCIWNGFTMEGREDDYTFSEPYMLNEQVIVVKAGSDIATRDDLAGKIVITQLGGAAEELLEGDEKDLADTFGRLDTIADYDNAYMQLESGTVEVVIGDLSIAQYHIANTPDTFVMLDEPLSSEHYAVGFKKGSEALADVINKTLLEMYEDGTVAEIVAKYAEYGVDINNWQLTK